jgi:hypothetical protein
MGATIKAVTTREGTKSSALTAYPNPASSFVTIEHHVSAGITSGSTAWLMVVRCRSALSMRGAYW